MGLRGLGLKGSEWFNSRGQKGSERTVYCYRKGQGLRMQGPADLSLCGLGTSVSSLGPTPPELQYDIPEALKFKDPKPKTLNPVP